MARKLQASDGEGTEDEAGSPRRLAARVVIIPCALHRPWIHQRMEHCGLIRCEGAELPNRIGTRRQKPIVEAEVVRGPHSLPSGTSNTSGEIGADSQRG